MTTYHYAHDNGNGTGATVNLGGTAAAGDILIIMTVGGADGGGLVAPVVTIGGASPTVVPISSGNIDSGVGSEESRAVLSYAVCVGSENQVFATWATGCNFGVEVLWISAPSGGVNEAYVIVQGAGSFHAGPNHYEVTGGHPSSDNEIYVGFTFNGRDGYTFADMIVNGGGADNGDGFDQSGAVKGIFHHHGNSHPHVMADDVGYGVNIMTTPYMGVMGVRTATAPSGTAYTDADTGLLVGIASGVEAQNYVDSATITVIGIDSASEASGSPHEGTSIIYGGSYVLADDIAADAATRWTYLGGATIVTLTLDDGGGAADWDIEVAVGNGAAGLNAVEDSSDFTVFDTITTSGSPVDRDLSGVTERYVRVRPNADITGGGVTVVFTMPSRGHNRVSYQIL